ncbi:MAG TPA: AraC family transcriptional regulator [Planctomycetaceae bacterium]|jgi:AraC family transcriptional regulator|nr:AraC family transcriptional regulator [Planctomycetaceae bacterium]
MSQPPDPPIRFRTLYESCVVSVRDYICGACRGGPAAEEYSDTNNIVLMRSGAFCKHFGRKGVVADVNQSAFFSRGSTYRVSHPADCGDRGTVLVASPAVLCDIVRELDPAVDDRPERPFPFVTGPCSKAVFLQHRELVQRLEGQASQPLEPLWADVTALQLVADVLEAAFARQGLAATKRRVDTEAEHVDLTEAVKSLLASRLRERLTLDEIAQAVDTSAFHLARVFQRQTGVPIHRYLSGLRLRTALERLEAGARDLTALALEFNFSSHSHFTDAFRREFGCPPSDLRKNSAPPALQMSKNLKVRDFDRR